MSDPYLPDIYPNSIGDDAYEALKPIVDRWGDPGEFLSVYVHGLALMLKPIDDISRDGPNGEPGWSQIFDLERMKTGWLPWAGQIVGYQVPSKPRDQSLADYDAKQRERMVTRAAWRNGTNDILYDVIAEQLNEPKRVIIQNRVGGNANQIKVWVYADDIATSAAEVEKVARANKAIGLIMEFDVLVGGDYETLRANSPTYQDVYTTFPTYNDVLTDPSA
jgi:hypothetical protein